ncbi:MAG: hypothetical protein IJE53_03910 [Bacilli bacterium]|nr:hypothetical protein [Bacilli bacterium]
MEKEVKKKKKDEGIEDKKVKNKDKKKFKINKKEENKKTKINKKLVFIISLLVICFIIGLLFLISYMRDVKKTKLAESEPIVSMLTDGSYYMMGASLDESFEVLVQDDFSYEVLDEDEKKVEVTEEKSDGNVVIKPTENGWDEGKTYTLKITNGKFTDSELSEANIVTFSTVRIASQSHKYTKNVEVVSNDSVKVNDNVIKTKRKLKVGEILVTEDSNNNPKAAYKITKVNSDGTYEVEIPKLEEVFSKFDYYNMEYLDLSEVEVNEEFAAYLASVAKKSIVDSLMLDVDAAAKVKVTYPKYNKKDKEVVFGVTLETDPGDKVFNKSFLKHHKLSTGYEVGIKAKAYENFESIVTWDVGIEFEIRQSIKSSIETESETLKKIKNDFSTLAADKTGINWLSDELYKIEKDDYGLDKKFGEVSVESGIPGIQILLTTNLLLDFDIKGNISSNLTNTTKVSFGYSTEKEFYATASTKNKMTADAMAEGKVRIGVTAKAGVELLNMVNLLGTGSVGLYGKGNISAKSEMTTDKMTNIVEAKIVAGTFAEIGAEANIIGNKLTFKGWSKEWPKVTKTIPFKSETVVKTESVSKEEPKEESKKEETPSAPAEVYYNVALYDLVVCSNAGFRNIANIKVKAGDTLYNALVAGVKENYIAEWNEYSYDNTYGVIWCDKVNGQTICEGRDDGLHYYDSSVPSQVAAYNNLYAQRNQCNAACGEEDWDCMTNCDNLYPYDNRPTVNTGLFNINTPINSNMSLIGFSLVGGCGSPGPEDEEY